MRVYVLIFGMDHVMGVFSTQEKAEAHIPDWSDDECIYRVDEYELDKLWEAD